MWNGSAAAQREHEEACRAHPVKFKSAKQRRRAARAARRKAKQTPIEKLKAMPYKEYLRSGWWRGKRQDKLRSTKGRCEDCGAPATEVHHLHYNSRGREKNKDLQSLCSACHMGKHRDIIEMEAHLRAIAGH